MNSEMKDYGYDDVAESYSSYRKEQSHYRELIAKIITTPFTMTMNFIFMKYLIEKIFL